MARRNRALACASEPGAARFRASGMFVLLNPGLRGVKEVNVGAALRPAPRDAER